MRGQSNIHGCCRTATSPSNNSHGCCSDRTIAVADRTIAVGDRDVVIGLQPWMLSDLEVEVGQPAVVIPS